jgi:hypothetical protein
MKSLVICESMYGNTRTIADAIADGMIAKGVQAQVCDVGSAPTGLGDVALLIVGAPTHAHGMSRAGTRENAVANAVAGVKPSNTGVREWLSALVPGTAGQLCATFDTRFDKPTWITGSAAKGAARQLRRAGATLVEPPMSFYVSGTTGPIIAGEVERARHWGEALATKITATVPS